MENGPTATAWLFPVLDHHQLPGLPSPVVQPDAGRSSSSRSIPRSRRRQHTHSSLVADGMCSRCLLWSERHPLCKCSAARQRRLHRKHYCSVQNLKRIQYTFSNQFHATGAHTCHRQTSTMSTTVESVQCTWQVNPGTRGACSNKSPERRGQRGEREPASLLFSDLGRILTRFRHWLHTFCLRILLHQWILPCCHDIKISMLAWQRPWRNIAISSFLCEGGAWCAIQLSGKR